MRSLLPSALGATCLLMVGCGGGGDHRVSDQLPGSWPVGMSFTVDECGLTESGRLEDTLVISSPEEASTWEVRSSGALDLGDPLRGDIGEDEVLRVSQRVAGTLDGIACELTQEIGFTLLSSSRGEVVYLQQIRCGQELVCESRAIGTAERE